ncbi:MAG: InlB B-repeat-containing protein [Clostridia bacterium]|nr:InlB B-repeat-containing protein [Clostridia bacterium]
MKKTTVILISAIAAVLIVAAIVIVVIVSAGANKKAELSFVTNGGAAIESVNVDGNTQYVLPTDLTREGYEFGGWYDNAEFSGSAYTVVLASENMTFYAKWDKLCAVTLDPDGGTGVPSVVYLKTGAYVKEGVSSYVPVKTGLVFGAWFDGDTELSSGTRITANGITLTARYKVEYTVKMFEHNLDGDAYSEVAPETGYYYVGETYSPEVARTGFDIADDARNVTALSLNADKNQNVYIYYFDRKTFQVNFFDGADPTTAKRVSVSVKYGEKTVLSYDLFEKDGYYFKGWATVGGGDVAYAVNYLDRISRNVDAETVQDTEITVLSTLNLFAVWDSAYYDMFGGHDLIFVPDPEGEYAYLNRGGVYFRGEFFPYSMEAVFSTEKEQDFIVCRINGDHSYSRYDQARTEITYKLYNGEETDDSVTLKFDEYNGLYYIEGTGTEEKRSYGVYIKNDDGDYEVTYSSGPHTGETMFIRLSSITFEGVSDTRVFRVRNDEEIALGEIHYGFVQTYPELDDYGKFVVYTNSYNSLKLSGFGTAQITGDGTVSSFTYVKDGDKITLTNAANSSVVSVMLIPSGSGYNYILYNEVLDGEFLADNGAKLKLNGAYDAVYTDAEGNDHSGLYSASDSVFGGFVISFYDGTVGDTEGLPAKRFLIKENVEVVGGGEIGDGNEPETIVTYELIEKTSGYAEYYYRQYDAYYGRVFTYIAPLLVLNDGALGTADFYGIVADTGEKVRIASGNYVAAAEKYQFIVNDITTVDDTAQYGVFDIFNVSSIVYSTENYTGYGMYYIISAVDKDEQALAGFSERYENDNGYLILSSAGYFISKINDNGKDYFYHGEYSLTDDLVTATAYSGFIPTKLYFETADASFIRLDTAPSKSYLLKESGASFDANTYISFDGKGGASYYENGVKKCDGTVEKTGEVTLVDEGIEVYSFTSADQSFKFINLYVSASGVYLYSPYNETYNAEKPYSSSDGYLVLDGYGYKANYRAPDGADYIGRYVIPENDVVIFTSGDDTFCFDINGNSFTKRGSEYGTYVFTENKSLSGVMVTLDGYETAYVFTMTDTGQTNYIDANATYTLENGLLTVAYKEGGVNKTIEGKFGVSDYVINGTSYNEIVAFSSTVAMTYVNDDDWAVLIVSDDGSATLYDSDGKLQSGTYVLITDELMFFEDLNDKDASYILKYGVNDSDATFGFVKNDEVIYFTEDLEALTFSATGFAVFNDEERYYYYLDGSGNVVLYKKGGENPNAYGFTEDDSFEALKDATGAYKKTLTYDGKDYLLSNGFSINFIRKNVDEEKINVGTDEETFIYPVPLSTPASPITEISFAPTGGSTFSGVSGTVKIGDDYYDCLVYRELDGDTDLPVMYAYVTRLGLYIYLDEIKYLGVDGAGNSNSTFKVNALTRKLSVNSFMFIDGYYRTYLAQGALAAYNYLQNDLYGVLSIVWDFENDGSVRDSYIDAEFKELTGLRLSDGSILKLEHTPFEANENGNIRVTIEDGGYTNYLYFMLGTHRVVGATGYYIQAFTRVETLITEDGEYKVEVERYLASDSGTSVRGAIARVSLGKKTDELGGDNEYIYEEIPLDGGITVYGDGTNYFISRTYEEASSGGNVFITNNKVISSRYYKVEFTENSSGILDDSAVATYSSVKVTPVDVTVYNSDEASSFIEVLDETGLPVIFVYRSKIYFVKEVAYDEETKTFTITTTSDIECTVTITDEGVAVFTMSN